MKKFLSVLLAAAMVLSMLVLPAAAEESPALKIGFHNVSGDFGDDVISLTQARSFQAVIPVDMTTAEAEAAAATADVYLIYNDTYPYVDAALYPNHTEGGELEDWTTQYGAGLFTNIDVTYAVVNDVVCLVVEFDNNIYFGSRNNRTGAITVDPSAPHSNGGAYLDLCGWYDLVVGCGDETYGGLEYVKVAPYDYFNTMAELYDSIDELVEFANAETSLYVEKGSMGMSQGDNGLASLDMPYIIIAKDKAAVDKWKSIKAQAESDPTALLAKIADGTLGDYQVPVLYSNVHANEVAATDGVMAFAWGLVEAAASTEGTLYYTDLVDFTDAGEAALAEQLGTPGAKNSIAVPDLVADTATYLGFIKGAADGSGTAQSGRVSSGTASRKLDIDAYYETEDVLLTVDELLDDVFFLLVPEENVEGRTYVTRTSSGGFDLNRDNSFQTQAETINMTRFIAQWNPVSFTEFHGRVTGFQCEPCDPPHEPNFEYDLLAEHLITGGEAFGKAAVANNQAYNSYCMPQRDYLSYTGNGTEAVWDPWDDMSTSYTPQYAMLHGTVAYTVELPAYNDNAAALVAYGALGQAKYVADEKEGYLTAQTKIFERGVQNFNSDAFELVGQWFCDQYDEEGAEMELFRPEYDGADQNGNFYPECYIIPLDSANQKNLDAADQMLTYLQRNGVKLMFADRAFTYKGVRYPAGTAVVSMYQAKRSVANGALYNGTFITTWPTLYSEGITAFNHTRGFDMITCAEPAAYKTIAAACTVKSGWTVRSSSVSADKVILRNTSEAAVAAVNDLLRAGKEVSVITEGDDAGSFLVSKADYKSVSSARKLTARDMTEDLTVRALTKAPVVFIPGKSANNSSGFVKTSLVAGAYNYNYDRQCMDLLGFTTTDDPAEADIIAGATAISGAALNAVKAGTPYIGYGSSVTSAVNNSLVSVSRGSVGGGSMDALCYVLYPDVNVYNASYVSEDDNILYGYGAGFYTSVPEGAEILARIDGSKTPLEGFMSSRGTKLADFLDDSIQGFSYQGADKNGNDISIVLFANSLTNKVHQRDELGFIANAAFAAVMDDEDTVVEAPTSSKSVSSTRDKGERTEEKTDDKTDDQADDKTDDTAATVKNFTDVKVNDWFANAVEYCADKGLVSGTSGNTFNPAMTTTRGMVMTVLARMAGADTAGGETWYEKAMDWAVKEGVSDGTAPEAIVTREQLATMLCRYAQTKGLDVSADPDANFLSWGDALEISDWARDGMFWAIEKGIITGKGGQVLDPLGQCTRAELVTMLMRFDALLK